MKNGKLWVEKPPRLVDVLFGVRPTDKMENAYEVACSAHKVQRRKYDNLLYMIHPVAVANKIIEVGIDNEDSVCAALLHDTVEDTNLTLNEIKHFFGDKVMRLVNELTDVSRPIHGNRAVRKEVDRLHTSLASSVGKSIKLADLIDNAQSIVKYDTKFAKVFIPEMEKTLEVLTQGNYKLLSEAETILENYYAH